MLKCEANPPGWCGGRGESIEQQQQQQQHQFCGSSPARRRWPSSGGPHDRSGRDTVRPNRATTSWRSQLVRRRGADQWRGNVDQRDEQNQLDHLIA